MSTQKENGLILEEKQGVIYLALKLTVKRQTLWTFLILLTLVFIVLGSSLDDDIRRTIVDFLIGAVQLVLFAEQRPKP
jgi:hypothetical protein